MNNPLQGRSLHLIGMMGAGKTTAGRLLAKQLDYRFFDTDVLIERVAGQSISTIFEQQGEDQFRQLESQVLAELSSYTRSVIATGGGIILRRENWGYLHHGIVVWLDASVETLYARLQHDTTRPLLQGGDALEKLRLLRSQRQSLYAQADLRVTITEYDTVSQIVARTLELLPTVLKPAVTLLEDPSSHDPSLKDGQENGASPE